MKYYYGHEKPKKPNVIAINEAGVIRVGYYNKKKDKFIIFHNGTGEIREVDVIDSWCYIPKLKEFASSRNSGASSWEATEESDPIPEWELHKDTQKYMVEEELSPMQDKEGKVVKFYAVCNQEGFPIKSKNGRVFTRDHGFAIRLCAYANGAPIAKAAGWNNLFQKTNEVIIWPPEGVSVRLKVAGNEYVGKHFKEQHLGVNGKVTTRWFTVELPGGYSTKLDEHQANAWAHLE